ncbi:MAG: metalloregulator ArsR/SmtB family transcription factor [Archangium sp.]|nr:metalloregulator ArsR/SmtB family transcription factor [Archangium sp.]
MVRETHTERRAGVVDLHHLQEGEPGLVLRRAGARLSSLDDTFTALADASRRGVIGLLRKKPRRAGELAAELGLSAPAMSRHLRLLREAGLVELADDEDDARAKVYSLRRERFEQLREWLDDVERFWTFRLEAFKEHAERTRR